MSVYKGTKIGVTEGIVTIAGIAANSLTDWVILNDTASHPPHAPPVIMTGIQKSMQGGLLSQATNLQWDSSGPYWKFRIQLSGEAEINEEIGYIATSTW